VEAWTGFIVGLFGSLHCVGMCGPIVAALPQGKGGRLPFLVGRLLYNFGRVLSYALIGLFFGLLGKSVFVAGYQQALSITVGVLIIFAVLLPARYSQGVVAALGLQRVYGFLSRSWGMLFRDGSQRSLLTIGFLNGFLPCGFVYLAIAGALATGSALNGAAYMASFGVGTIPILLAFSYIGNVVGTKFRAVFARAIPALAVTLALLFILRGMSLGIPILSPKITYDVASGTTKHSCCEQEAAP
jgi:uncharacterized protein